SQCFAGLRPQVYGAEDGADRDRTEVRGVLKVDAGPDRALGVMQHFGGIRTQDEAPEGAIAVRRHNDQAHVLRVSVFDDSLPGIAFEDDSLDLAAGEFVYQETVELDFDLLGAIA